MRIREAAAEVGFSPDLFRRLERQGILPPPPRDYNGHRRYTPEHLDRVRALLLPPVAEDRAVKLTERG